MPRIRSPRVCCCVCVSLAPLRRTIFQLAALLGTGLVKVETNYTTPHPRIKSINKSQKQQARQRQGQKQQQQRKQKQEQEQREKKGTVQPASFYISQCALGPQSLVHNTFNLPDKQRTPNTISPPSPSVNIRTHPCPFLQTAQEPCPPPSPCGRFSLSCSPSSPSHPLCSSVIVVFVRVAFLCCHLFRHLCKTLLLSLVLCAPWDFAKSSAEYAN